MSKKKSGILTALLLVLLMVLPGTMLLTMASDNDRVTDLSTPGTRASTRADVHISSNTTWSTAGGDVTVDGNLYIWPGVVLTIEQGVNVYFTGYDRVYVGGTLVINGTGVSPVFFGTTQSPGSSRWQGLYVNSTGKIYGQHFNVSYANNAIYVNGQVFLESVNVYYINNYGIYLENADGSVIRNASVSRTNGFAFRAYSSPNFILDGFNASFINSYGIYLDWWNDDSQISRVYMWEVYSGIRIYYNNRVNLSDVRVYARDYGINLYNSENIDLYHVRVLNKPRNYGYNIYGDSTARWEYTFTSSYYMDRKLEAIKDQSGGSLSSTASAMILLLRCDNYLISDIDTSTWGSVYIIQCSDIRVDNVNSSYNQYGIYLWNTNGAVIKNCSTQHGQRGIYVTQSDNVRVENHTSVGEDYGIYFDNSDHGVIRDCTSIGGSYGFQIQYCVDLTMVRTVTRDCTRQGFTFYQNTMAQGDWTVKDCLVQGDALVYYHDQSSLVINGGTFRHLTLSYCTGFSLSNSNFVHDHDSLKLLGSSGTVRNCHFQRSGQYGIYAHGAHNTIIDSSTFDNPDDYAVYASSSNHLNVTNNYMYRRGVYTSNCDWVYIDSNYVDDPINYGIYTNSCDNSMISHNTIYSANSHGIRLYYCNYMTIFDNDIDSGSNWGIYCYGSGYHDLNITTNRLSDNSNGGIYVNWYSNSKVYRNDVYGDNGDEGVYLSWTTNTDILENRIENFNYCVYLNNDIGTRVLRNSFYDCGNGAYDSGSQAWDDGALGNYWDWYTDTDANGDLIWDNPYIIDGNSVDHYPSTYPLPDLTPPVITLMNCPDGFLQTGLDIDLDIFDHNTFSAQCGIDGGALLPLIYPYDIPTLGWSEGHHSIRVVAADIWNNVNDTTFDIVLDSSLPTITLVSPAEYSTVTSGATLDLEVSDDHLAMVNYSINGGPLLPFSSPYDISTLNWPQGTYPVRVVAVDKAGNTATRDLVFQFIDGQAPVVALVSPADGSALRAGTSISMSVVEANLKTVTYTVDGSDPLLLLAPFVISTSGISDGAKSFVVTAVDSAGNTGTTTFTMTFDSTSPTLSVKGHDEEEFYLTPGEPVDLLVADDHLSTVTYTGPGGSRTLSTPYRIDTTGWSEGRNPFTITARDTVGNEVRLSVVVMIDATGPIVVSYSPHTWETFTDTAIITFDGPVDPSGIAGAVSVPGLNFTYSLDGATLTLTRSSDLPEGVSSLTLTVSPLLTDLHGNNMASSFSMILVLPASGVQDSDGDGIPDEWERLNGLDDEGADANEDPDGDGLTNLQEYLAGTDPLDADTDGDLLTDGYELNNGLDPRDASDGSQDSDRDGYTNSREAISSTNPLDSGSRPAGKSSSLLGSWMAYLLAIIVLLVIFIVLALMITMRLRKQDDTVAPDSPGEMEVGPVGPVGPAPEDELEPPEDELEPPEDELEPPEDGVEPPEDELEPPEDGVEPPEDGVEPPEDELEPPEDKSTGTFDYRDTLGEERHPSGKTLHPGKHEALPPSEEEELGLDDLDIDPDD